jgi:hypothetical protein
VRKPTWPAGPGPDSSLAERLQQLERLVVGQLGELGLDLRVEEDRLGRGDQRPHLVLERLVASSSSSTLNT